MQGLNDEVEAASGRVAISTMHLAKGLEFRAVVVMACDDEVIPLQERIETVTDDADLEEVYDTERHLSTSRARVRGTTAGHGRDAGIGVPDGHQEPGKTSGPPMRPLALSVSTQTFAPHEKNRSIVAKADPDRHHARDEALDQRWIDALRDLAISVAGELSAADPTPLYPAISFRMS